MTSLHAVMEWLAGGANEMQALLADLVSIDSNSCDPEGVAAVAGRIPAFFDENGNETRRIATGGSTEALAAEIGAKRANEHSLLLGHMDTAFSRGRGRAAALPRRRQPRIRARLLRHEGGAGHECLPDRGLRPDRQAPHRIVALFGPNEEIGSPHGRAVIEEHARGAIAVFNAEPGRANGNVVFSRRGGTLFRSTVTGRAAHAGLNPHEGRSAIEEIARKTLAWHALSGETPDVSVNIGLVSGGEVVNMVAPIAEALINLRFTEPQTGEEKESEIRRIATTCTREGLSGAIARTGGFLPVVETPASNALLDIYLGAPRALGQETWAQFTRSCADSGFTAGVGAPTVCATDPVGGKAHSPDEYVELDTFVPRAEAVARSIFRLSGRE